MIAGRDLPACHELLALGAVIHFGSMPPMTRDQYRDLGAAFLAGFTDFALDVHEQLTADDKVVTRLAWRARHTGNWLGIPATGKDVATTGLRIERVVDGRIVEAWVQDDMTGVLQQIGVLPPLG